MNEENERVSCDDCDLLFTWDKLERIGSYNDSVLICSDCESKRNAPKCSQCSEVLVDTYWTCYGNSEFSSDNMVCGKGDCWADWIQNHMEEYQIEDCSKVQ